MEEPAGGFCTSLSLLAQLGKGPSSTVVPVCWVVCKLIVRDSRCPEENVVLINGRRNEAAREVPAVAGGWGSAGKRIPPGGLIRHCCSSPAGP